MSLAVLVFTDGRGELLLRTMESFREAWGDHPVERIILINDSADNEYASFLDRNFPHYERVHHPKRAGFGGAIRSGWEQVRGSRGVDFVFHLEDDFTFNEPLDIFGMMEVLNAHSHLVQLALKRQPWNEEEIAAGDLMRVHWDDYEDKEWLGYRWVEHSRFFTTNPSLYRGSLLNRGWPKGPNSEGMFGIELLRSWPEAKFGFWGQKTDPPKVTHIGAVRAGSGY